MFILFFSHFKSLVHKSKVEKINSFKRELKIFTKVCFEALTHLQRVLSSICDEYLSPRIKFNISAAGEFVIKFSSVHYICTISLFSIWKC